MRLRRRWSWRSAVSAKALALLACLAGPAFAEGSASSATQSGTVRAVASGFTDDLPGAEPKRNRPYREVPALMLPDPATARVVIWSHGTSDSAKPENCNAAFNGVPPSLRALVAEGVHLWFECSGVSLRPSRENAGDHIYLRMGEVSAAVERFLALGVRPGNIFLAGHSTGGWVSLMLARAYGGRIGGIIAYAPAFARPRADIAKYPYWRKEVMPRQAAEIVAAPAIRALVFAYERDAFDRPQELAFLTERWPEAVRMVAYTCDAENDHASHMQDCELDRSTAEVRRFVLGK